MPTATLAPAKTTRRFASRETPRRKPRRRAKSAPRSRCAATRAPRQREGALFAATAGRCLIGGRKKDVAIQRPERIDKNWFVPMTPEQRGHHQENAEIVAKIVARWRRFHYMSEADRRRLLVALQNMRMSCDSSYLLDQSSEHGTKPDELATLLEEILEERDATGRMLASQLEAV